MPTWEIHGRELISCNCVYACPCQFNAYPDKGHCEAVGIFEIEKGHHGDVKLDGVRMAAVYKFPGAIHEGGGTMQLYIDDKATDAQAAALERIMTGEDTEEFATFWWVFHKMASNVLETKRAPISLSLDIDERTGKGAIGDLITSAAVPIRNPVTGAPHRVRINLPHGFEYRIAEVGSGSAQVSGDIRIDGIKDSYAQMAELHISNTGVLEAA